MSVTSPSIRVLIADNHPVYRNGVSQELEATGGFDVVGVCQDGQEALKAIIESEPDVAVLDYRMPLLNGGQVARAVTEASSSTKILILSAFTEDSTVYQALQDGACGYLTKESEPEDIAKAVEACFRGEPVLPPKLAAGLISEIRSRTELRRPSLTDREREVLKLLAAGMSTPDIARAIYLAPSTVKTHLQHLCDKLGVSGRAAVVAEAMRRGILT
ncbi:response regulator transcription factor [Streptomyces wuyuanensis]|uniref:response regulator transcription factor n=1 Tax=Streptomyces wuyuanensis TaxID=1196353 RepID=UPI0034418BE4